MEVCSPIQSQPRRNFVAALALALVLGFGLLSPNLSGPHATAQSGGATVASAEKIVQLTNQVRSKKGLPPLTPLAPLDSAALAHSQEMLELDYFSHSSPVTGRVGDRIRRAGASWSACAENIYRSTGYPLENVAAETVDAWVRSPGHYKNIVNTNFTHIGVGVVYKNEEAVVTQVFVRN